MARARVELRYCTQQTLQGQLGFKPNWQVNVNANRANKQATHVQNTRTYVGKCMHTYYYCLPLFVG